MSLNFPAVVITPPNDVTICEGQDAVFTCVLHDVCNASLAVLTST